VGAVPDTVVLERDRDLVGRRNDIWIRRGLFALVGLIPLLAVANLFGQRPQTARAGSEVASLELRAPSRVRSGLLFEARFHIRARREVKDARLVLSPGWLESMTLNTVEPSPVGESSMDGRLSFQLGHIRAGTSYLLFLQFQINPTNVGHRDQSVWLYDDGRLLLRLHRAVTIFP
jgi:hypothetical protein